MGKLRSQYSIKNPNVEPRIFSFFEPYGIEISVWYMTNSYATLGLRSNISAEILDALRSEPDIKIAYPAYTLFNGKNYAAAGRNFAAQDLGSEQQGSQNLNAAAQGAGFATGSGSGSEI